MERQTQSACPQLGPSEFPWEYFFKSPATNPQTDSGFHSVQWELAISSGGVSDRIDQLRRPTQDVTFLSRSLLTIYPPPFKLKNLLWHNRDRLPAMQHEEPRETSGVMSQSPLTPTKGSQPRSYGRDSTDITLSQMITCIIDTNTLNEALPATYRQC